MWNFLIDIVILSILLDLGVIFSNSAHELPLKIWFRKRHATVNQVKIIFQQYYPMNWKLKAEGCSGRSALFNILQNYLSFDALL